MSEQPIKLMDEIVRDVYAHLVSTGYDKDLASHVVAAIRALRDRAKAVVHEADNQGEYDRVRYCKVIDDRIIDALREVLP